MAEDELSYCGSCYYLLAYGYSIICLLKKIYLYFFVCEYFACMYVHHVDVWHASRPVKDARSNKCCRCL